MSRVPLAELERGAQEMGRRIDGALNPRGKRIGFVLWLFSFEPGFATYVSNAEREDMVAALEELLEKLRAAS